MRLGVKMTRVGDWQKMADLIPNITKLIKKAEALSLITLGKKAERVVKGHIKNQDLGWIALKDRTVRRKELHNQDPRTLMATSDYINSIVGKYDSANKSVSIYVAEGATNREGFSLKAIAEAHEYGVPSRNIPKRPLWKPSFEEVINWHIENNLPAKFLARDLKKNYGIDIGA